MPRGSAIVDASVVVALLADRGEAGAWAAESVAGVQLAAPDLMPFEVANILRRQVLRGRLESGIASLIHADLVALPVDFCPYAILSERVWELRANLTAYDASYVALAELAEVPLVTLDARLSRAPAIRCDIVAYRPR